VQLFSNIAPPSWGRGWGEVDTDKELVKALLKVINKTLKKVE
jgi:hypothetical protein